MDNLRSWWSGLLPREQQMMSIAAVFVVIGIIYWGIWTPLSEAEESSINKLQAQQQTLTKVKNMVSQIASLKQSDSAPLYRGSLSSAANQTAAQYGLVITRMQPQANKIQIWMDEVPFDALLNYLNDLVQQKGLSLDSIDLAETEQPGVVKVRRIQLSQ